VCWIGIMAAVAAAGLAAGPARAGTFETETLAPGVHVLRNVTAGFPGRNSLVVERADGLLVVDAQPTPEAGRALLAAIATISKLPVRYLVFTHAHDDAMGGASAFGKDVLVVASTGARNALADPSYDAGAEIRSRSPDPQHFVEPPRVLPVLHSDGPMTLDDPRHRVVLYPLPRVHSRGDLWVEVPSAGVMAVGDVVVTDRNPYGADADVPAWISALNDLARSDASRIVPGAGPVVGPLEVKRMRDGLAWVRQGVQRAFTDLADRETIVPGVLADPKLADFFDLRAKPSFVRTIVDATYQSVLDDRRKHGLP
jgi:glyoxylase-like metal-dependent hydrolase (beta-lactamase superfamily II)